MSDTNKGNSLADFPLDDGEDWFNNTTTSKKDKGEKLIEDVKNQEDDPDDEEDDDNEEIVDKKDSKKKEDKKNSKKKEEEEEEETNEEFFNGKKEKVTNRSNDNTSNLDKKDSKDKNNDKEVEEEEENEDDKDFFTNLAVDLKAKGVFANVEIPKDAKITEDKFFESFDEEIEKRVDETFESMFEEIGKEGIDYLKYIKNGGKSSTFLAQTANTFNLDELDPENDNQVTKVLKHYLSVYEKLDDDDVDDKIKWLQDGGKAKAKAVKYFKDIKADEEEAKEQLLNSQESEAKKKRDNNIKFNENLREVISKADNLEGIFSLSKTEQKEIDNYLTKPVVKNGKDSYIPEFMAELTRILSGKNKDDRTDLVKLAKVIKSKFKIEAVKEADAETKVTGKIKSKLISGRNNVRPTSSSTSNVKSLADYIDS